MTNELENFYNDNHKRLDESYTEFCFYEGRFESHEDAKKHYNNDRYFWEFVENVMESIRSWG